MNPRNMLVWIRDELREAGDVNNDGKVDQQDIDVIVARAEVHAEEFMVNKTPLKGLAIAFFLGVLVTALIAYSIAARAEPVGPNQIRVSCKDGFCLVPEEDLKKLIVNNDQAVSTNGALRKLLAACKTARQT